MVVIAVCNTFPQILTPGALENLNCEALTSLGTPLFFSSPDLKRPHSSESRGRFYEVVTGLYVVYHDYGSSFLLTFLRFCKQENIPTRHNPMLKHYHIICNLRGALCHGGLENGFHLSRSCSDLRQYLPEPEGTAPLNQFDSLSEADCTAALEKLCAEADSFFDQLRLCIKEVSSEPSQRSDWKEHLIQTFWNPPAPKYGKATFYFDQRIVNDLARAVRAGNIQTGYEETVRNWLLDLEQKIETDSIPNTDYLRLTLSEALYKLYHPQEFLAEKSSADLLFDL